MPVMGHAEIENRIQAFRSDLKTLTDKIMVQKHITSGESFVLAEDQYFSLKYDVSGQFELHPSQIIVVGSGKLGFSIVPRKRYRPFGDESDLDVAIVSDDLFHVLWAEVFEYWNDRGCWEREAPFR